MKADLLKLEVELLLLKYGESSVVREVALSLNSSEEDILKKIEALRAKKDKSPKAARPKKSPLDVAKEVVAGAENEDLLTDLAILYQNKQFLSELKDVKRFFGRFNISKEVKSRNEGTRLVFEALYKTTREELSDFILDSNSGGQSSFSKLADHIIGGNSKESSNKSN